MKRLLINGSPRGKNSNTRVILSWIAEGIAAADKESTIENIPLIDLARTQETDKHRKAFLDAEEIVFAMPLYTDAMPGLVKNFIDSFGSIPAGTLAGKRVAFIIQSGFPESIHSEALAAYLERLTRRCGWVHAGTIIKGGMEGTRLMPPRMTAKVHKRFQRAAYTLVSDGRFDPPVVAKMAKPRQFGVVKRMLFTLLNPLSIFNMYWNMMLKKHGAYKRRFDAPYGKAYGEK